MLQVGRETDHVPRRRLAQLRELRGPGVPDFPDQVREVVIVASSSRGGSSVLAELLRSSRALLHLSAECNPFLRMVGLAHPESGSGSDRLDAGHHGALAPEPRRVLAEELALDAGQPGATVDDERFLLHAAWRFTIQWPQLDFDLDHWLATARRVLERVRADEGWGREELRSPTRFHVALLHQLCADGLPVDARYYDLPDWQPAGDGDGAGSEPGGAPSRLVLEEPPFVVPRPWRPAGESDLLTKALVIKAPSNAYRLPFLRALFPNARLRVIHLTRNPGAVINGLIDGWRYHGFHAHRLPEPLDVAGYAEDRPGDRWWWKFDLPPGWDGLVTASLPEVCAFQWLSAHRAILADLDAGDVDAIQVRAEDLMGDAGRRLACAGRISEWLGVPFDAPFQRAVRDGPGPVMATAPPRAGRWRRRAGAIRAACDPEVLAMARRLGYGDEDHWV